MVESNTAVRGPRTCSEPSKRQLKCQEPFVPFFVFVLVFPMHFSYSLNVVY